MHPNAPCPGSACGVRENYLFWFRLAQYLKRHRLKVMRHWGSRINTRLLRRYGIDISFKADIGPGLSLVHPVGIVITSKMIAGRNLSVFQNVTIGQKHDHSAPIIIGDDVTIGPGAIIIGDGITIGDRATIAAGAFVNRDVPADHTVISKRLTVLIPQQEGRPAPISSPNSRRRSRRKALA